MDKYDRAIEYLAANPGEINAAWVDHGTHKAGCLFRYATPSGHTRDTTDIFCGCLTMIRNQNGVAYTEALTKEILADERIPRGVVHFKEQRGDELRRTLEVFAHWQRRLDREIRGIIDPEAPPVETPAVIAPVQVLRHGNWCGTSSAVDFVPVITTTEALEAVEV